MSEEMKRVGEILLAEKSAYRLIGKRLFEKLNEANFADLYPAQEQPGLLQVILAFVTVFQFYN
jgi:hypothetical protein